MKMGIVGSTRWLVCLGLAISLAASGCGGGDDDDDDGSSGPEPGADVPVGTLEDECADYCAKEESLSCPNAIPNCTRTCISLGEMFPECEPEWTALNHCMAHAELICDSAGNAAVGPECFDRVDAFGACLGESE